MALTRTVILVDDDPFFVQSTKEWLEDDGFKVLAAGNIREAKQVINENSNTEAVVLDIMMPSGGDSELETRMGYKSGLVLARWIKQNYPNIKIVGMSAATSLDVREWFEHHDLPYFVKGSGEFIDGLNTILKKAGQKKLIKTFIVHGHDEAAKYELKNFLQNTLKLPEPIILHEQPSLGRTLIEKFEDVASQIDLVFILLTPDDSNYDVATSNDSKRRTRQNVIFEMGYFFGKLQRRKGRVVLLHKGSLELPSDIVGIIYVDISNGIEASGETIRKELSFIL